VLDDRLRSAAEMAQIGKADAVNSGRQAAFPAAPDQTSYVEKEGRVVGHSVQAAMGVEFRPSQEDAAPSTRARFSPEGLAPGNARVLRCRQSSRHR